MGCPAVCCCMRGRAGASGVSCVLFDMCCIAGTVCIGSKDACDEGYETDERALIGDLEMTTLKEVCSTL